MYIYRYGIGIHFGYFNQFKITLVYIIMYTYQLKIVFKTSGPHTSFLGGTILSYE